MPPANSHRHTTILSSMFHYGLSSPKMLGDLKPHMEQLAKYHPQLSGVTLERCRIENARSPDPDKRHRAIPKKAVFTGLTSELQPMALTITPTISGGWAYRIQVWKADSQRMATRQVEQVSRFGKSGLLFVEGDYGKFVQVKLPNKTIVLHETGIRVIENGQTRGITKEEMRMLARTVKDLLARSNSSIKTLTACKAILDKALGQKPAL